MTSQPPLLLPAAPTANDVGDVNFGEVFTRRWVVELILDLVGYVDQRRDISACRLLDPACGDGAFVVPAVHRIAAAAAKRGRPWGDLAHCIVAFDLQADHVVATRRSVAEVLTDYGASPAEAAALVGTWVRHGDFLLDDLGVAAVDFVVGNPPYIRLEEVGPERQQLYRRMYATMTGRSDIYVGFFERGLSLLSQGGKLAFICADRWMKNAYGKVLRNLVLASFSVDLVLEMHDVDAFAEQVAAYPAITVISRSRPTTTTIGAATRGFGERDAADLSTWLQVPPREGDQRTLGDGSRLSVFREPFAENSAWPTGDPQLLNLVRSLEASYDPVESARTRIGIGVATGADNIFITRDPSTVETDRLVPLVMTSDIRSGSVRWGERYLVNPWAAPARLVDLEEFPRLREYFRSHEVGLRRRHTAKKSAEGWYRTIDPVHTDLIAKPKLLFPDMKMVSKPVLESGGLYPHHNLYYIVSDEWDLAVLGGLLSSKMAQAFIEAYAVRMRGGTLRFQAQYLRTIRVPRPESIPAHVAAGLKRAFIADDTSGTDYWAREAFGTGIVSPL